MANGLVTFIVFVMIIVTPSAIYPSNSLNFINPNNNSQGFFSKLFFPKPKNLNNVRMVRSSKAEYAFPHYETYNKKHEYPLKNQDQYTQKDSRGIHLVAWRWDEIGVFFTFTAFVIVSGLAKIGFHHANWLSSWLPESCLMIIMGVILGAILFLSGVPEPENEKNKVVPDGEFALPTFTPRLFFLVLLPPVILESAYSLYDRSFADNLSTILIYAVAGTFLNTFLVGPLLYALALGGVMGIIKLTLRDTIVFAALISAVDPVAVLAIFQEVGVNKDLYYLLFGESLLNDAVTVVLYTTTVTFTGMENIDGTQFGLAIIAFFAVSLGGLVIGIFFGLVTALITKTTKDVRVVEPLAILGISYLSYLAAELFHFSGIISIIGCGVVQAHYAFKNISDHSRITVTYFTKMISSTSDAIIFLFLGMVLVSKRHVWHTGFVLWTLLLCFLSRFIGVLCLTSIINIYRVRKINFQEQFIMAYGGLRGAVAFSLVTMLDGDLIKSQPIFLTTTLVVILFTVFIQGGTIKWLVRLLRIKKSTNKETTMNEELNDNIMRTMMAGIEEISGVRGDFYVRRKIQHIDEHYLKKIFLNTTKSNSLTRLYEKLALTQHIAHLYGPVVLVEDQKAKILHENEYTASQKKLSRSMSARHPAKATLRLKEIFPGVQLRRRTMSDTNRPNPLDFETSALKNSTEQLRKAFRASAYNKLREKYNPNLTTDIDDQEMLRRRHEMAQRITYQAALSHRHSNFSMQSDGEHKSEEFTLAYKKIFRDAEGLDSETLEGIDVILERTRQKIARHNSNSEIFPDISLGRNKDLTDLSPNSPLILSEKSKLYRSSRNVVKAKKTSKSYNENYEILNQQKTHCQKPKLQDEKEFAVTPTFSQSKTVTPAKIFQTKFMNRNFKNSFQIININF